MTPTFIISDSQTALFIYLFHFFTPTLSRLSPSQPLKQYTLYYLDQMLFVASSNFGNDVASIALAMILNELTNI